MRQRELGRVGREGSSGLARNGRVLAATALLLVGCGGGSSPIEPPAALRYGTNPATYTVDVPITANLPSSSGGLPDSYTVEPALPAGLSLNRATGAIGGTPTAITSRASYTITASNGGGSTNAILSIAVVPPPLFPPASLTYSANPATYTVGVPITPNVPHSSGGPVAMYSASTLPPGLHIDPVTGVISGTPNLPAAAAAHLVTATNAAGSTSVSLVVAVEGQSVDVTIYWEFDRNTFVDGVVGVVPYDTTVNWPPGTGSRGCPQSGVDDVDISDTSGHLLASFVPCVNQSVQGAVVTGVPGPNTYVVTGWNRGSTEPWYQGTVTVNAVPGAFNFGTAIAAGIPSNLTIDMILQDSFNPVGYPTCGLAGVNRFQGWVEDGFGTLVWRNQVNCGPAFSPSIQYGPVDRDVLFVWIDTYDDRVTPPDVPWSICGFQFTHERTSLFSLPIPLGLCNNPPPP